MEVAGKTIDGKYDLVGGFNHISQWEGFSHILYMENKKCSKPPTRIFVAQNPFIFGLDILVFGGRHLFSVTKIKSWLRATAGPHLDSTSWHKTFPWSNLLFLLKQSDPPFPTFPIFYGWDFNHQPYLMIVHQIMGMDFLLPTHKPLLGSYPSTNNISNPRNNHRNHHFSGIHHHFPMGFLWVSWVPMVFLWFSYGFPMVFMVSYGFELLKAPLSPAPHGFPR